MLTLLRHFRSTLQRIMKVLVAFDFDHTIIEENSDLFVRKLAPGGKIPQEITDLYSDKGWTKYMAAIFRYLHENNTTAEQMHDCMKEIPLVEGMRELFEYLSSDMFNVIIISDSNSMFIDWIMKEVKLDHIVDCVYTNPAAFDDTGCLTVDYYHTQDWCDLSTINLCKGHILDAHIDEQRKKGITYDLVAYAGDGTNDLCPSLRLKGKHDLALPRIGFSLMKKLNNSDTKNLFSCKIVPWRNGTDIHSVLRDAIKSL